MYKISRFGLCKVDEKFFWTRGEAREGAGRRRFKEKELKRTLARQRKDIRKKSFASRVQDPWNNTSDGVKMAKTPPGVNKNINCL